MLTRKQVLEAVKNGRESECLDSRDYSRLTEFFNFKHLADFGFTLKEGAIPPKKCLPWTENEILKHLKSDVSFGFEKALNQRGISSSLMYEVVKMWMWILEDDLQSFGEYAQYGLPLFKAVALEYGFDNPIGDDTGSEHKYEEY